MATTITFGVLLPTVGGDADLWGGYLNTSLQLLVNNLVTRTSAYDFADNNLQKPVLLDYSETLQTVAYSATPTVDLALGNHCQTTLAGNITDFTVSNPPPTGKVGILRWYLTQDGTGERTITPPAAFKPVGNVVPYYETAANATNIFIAVTRNGGTTWDYRIESGFVGL